VCDLLTRRGRTPLVLASCAVSRFRETNHEFVQSNEWELAVEEGGRWRVVGVVRTEREAEGWLYAPAGAMADSGA